MWDGSGVPKRCNGAPVVRERKREVLYGSKFFLGFTGFHRPPNFNHAIRTLDSLDMEGLSFLSELLSGRVSPPRLDYDQECLYIHSKKKRCSTDCPVHRDVFIQVPCEEHKINIFEPIPQPDVEVPKMVYVSCFGKHTHPVAPTPDHTLRKMRLLDAEAELYAKATPAVLRKRVEEKLLKQVREGVGGPKVFGSVRILTASGSLRIRTLRQSKRKVVTEAEGLISLNVDMTFPYCRDIKLVGPDIAVTWAHDSMLIHAVCTKFAGDATYKTVTERTRRQVSGRWYLYVIIAPASTDVKNMKCVVVYRAIMTGLSAEIYQVIWTCGFREIISCPDNICGEGLELDSFACPTPSYLSIL